MSTFQLTEEQKTLLQTCSKAKAAQFIERLGLLPDNHDKVATGAKPSFRSNEVAQSLYEETGDIAKEWAEKYTKADLQQSLSGIDFVAKATNPFLDKYGDLIWGWSRDYLRHDATDLYPEHLYLEEEVDRQRIQVFLCCWIAVRAFRLIKPEPQTGIQSSKPGNKGRQPEEPDEIDALPKSPSHQSPSRTGIESPSRAALSPSHPSFRAPSAPMYDKMRPTIFSFPRTPKTLQALNNRAPVNIQTDPGASNKAIGRNEYTGSGTTPPPFEDKDTSGDYDPNVKSPTSRKRKRPTIGINKNKMSRKGKERETERHANRERVVSVPLSPDSVIAADKEPGATPFLQEQRDEDAVIILHEDIEGWVHQITEDDHPVYESGNQSALSDEVNVAQMRRSIERSTPYDYQRAILAKELFNHLRPEKRAFANYDVLLKSLDFFAKLDEDKLKDRFGAEYLTHENAAFAWMVILKGFSVFRKTSEYRGAVEDWSDYCDGLPSWRERLDAAGIRTELRYAISKARKDNPFLDSEDLSKNLAPYLMELIGPTTGFSLEDMRHSLVDFNESLLAWATYG